jgi:hypothetical protein
MVAAQSQKMGPRKGFFAIAALCLFLLRSLASLSGVGLAPVDWAGPQPGAAAISERCDPFGHDEPDSPPAQRHCHDGCTHCLACGQTIVVERIASIFILIAFPVSEPVATWVLSDDPAQRRGGLADPWSPRGPPELS